MAEQTITIEVSPGELLDKITILEIKAGRINDARKLRNVRKELAALSRVRDAVIPSTPELDALLAELKNTNEYLWQIEEDIRACERESDFGQTFVFLARTIYLKNDQRADLKRRMNDLLGATLQEEKDYQTHGVAAA